ncbi:hypothetical protein SLS58_009571 [Diplodia intermedia]|uniref:RNA ligase domain-containing protein n=1 Tax=Diplodia intermedia TaxID=856260 RepID=A0ABR3TBL6_9PEZI
MDTTTTTSAAPNKATLYPKIPNDIRPLIRTLKEHLRSTDATQPRGGRRSEEALRMTGTVKLHGTHADIRVDLAAGAGAVVAQSRNNAALTPARDNFGFAAFCVERRPAIVELAGRDDGDDDEKEEEEEEEKKNDDDDDDRNITVILAGEWIGNGIQARPHTAIRNLSPRLFVLCGIRVVVDGAGAPPEEEEEEYHRRVKAAAMWEPIERYADIADEPARLYNISRGGFFHLQLKVTTTHDGYDNDEDNDNDSLHKYGNVTTAADVASFLAEARRLTDAVHARCPFGASLGAEGPGEGIVWTPGPMRGDRELDDVPNVPGFWLKTKAEDFEGGRPRRRDPNEQAPARDEVKERVVEAFLRRACYQGRLEQGWDYLREMHVERDVKGLGRFLSWVLDDIQVEEKEEIAELKLSGSWKKGAINLARTWYLRQLEKGNGNRDEAATV